MKQIIVLHVHKNTYYYALLIVFMFLQGKDANLAKSEVIFIGEPLLALYSIDLNETVSFESSEK